MVGAPLRLIVVSHSGIPVSEVRTTSIRQHAAEHAVQVINSSITVAAIAAPPMVAVWVRFRRVLSRFLSHHR